MTPTPAGRNPGLSAWRFDTGRLCLDFVGTIGHRPAEHVERLTSPQHLRAWMSEAGLPASEVRLGALELSRARELREALHAALDCAVTGGPETSRAQPTALAAPVLVVNDAAAAAPLSPQLTLDSSAGASELAVEYAAPGGIAPFLATIARDALDLLNDRQLRAKLRRCDAGDCQKIFLDTAPRPRRWCSRQFCGTRSRVAAHRARTASSRSRTNESPPTGRSTAESPVEFR